MSRIFKPAFESKDERGTFKEIISGGIWQNVNYSNRKKGSILGNHYHKIMKELIFVFSGLMHVKIENLKNSKIEEFDVKANEGFIIHPYEKHTLEVIEDVSFIALLSEKFDNKNPDIFK